MFGSGLLLEVVDDDQLLAIIVEEKNALIELLRLWETHNKLIRAIVPHLLKDVETICTSSTHYLERERYHDIISSRSRSRMGPLADSRGIDSRITHNVHLASATALFREDSIGTKLLRGCLFTLSSRRYLDEIVLPVVVQSKALSNLEVQPSTRRLSLSISLSSTT